MKTKRYECILRLGQYKVRVKVFATDPTQVEALAKAKATKLLNRFTKPPCSLLEIEMIGVKDCGYSQEHADMLFPSVM